MHLLALCSSDCSPGCWAGRGDFRLMAAVLLLSRGGCRGNVLIVGLFGAQSSEWSWALWQPRGTAQKNTSGDLHVAAAGTKWGRWGCVENLGANELKFLNSSQLFFPPFPWCCTKSHRVSQACSPCRVRTGGSDCPGCPRLPKIPQSWRGGAVAPLAAEVPTAQALLVEKPCAGSCRVFHPRAAVFVLRGVCAFQPGEGSQGNQTNSNSI